MTATAAILKTDNALKKLVAFLQTLEANAIPYHLDSFRDSVAVLIAIPGERWEIEFFDDAHVEVERFRSSGEIGDESAFSLLFADDDD